LVHRRPTVIALHDLRAGNARWFIHGS
jgi:hypothetical protein